MRALPIILYGNAPIAEAVGLLAVLGGASVAEAVATFTSVGWYLGGPIERSNKHLETMHD